MKKLLQNLLHFREIQHELIIIKYELKSLFTHIVLILLLHK